MGYIARIGAFAARFVRRREDFPIDDLERLADFVASRAAFIAQKSLYGYLRTRIGTRYPKVFEEEPFVESINIAKMHVYAACVSDLAIYAVACASQGTDVSDGVRRAIALRCFDHAMAANAAQALPEFDADVPRAELLLRLDGTDWGRRARTRDNFDHSPAALVRWAPIAPELKRHDTEIVENSVRFAWNEVRQEFGRRLDTAGIAGEIRECGAAGTPAP